MANTLTQNPTVASYASATTVTKTFAASCTTGSLLVAILTCESRTNTLSVSDATNGAWTTDINVQGAATVAPRVIIASVQNTATTALTVTGTIGTSDSGFLKIFEITGQATSSVLDTTGSQTTPTQGNSANTSASFTTGSANDTIIAGWGGYGNPTATVPDSGYTTAFGPTAVVSNYHYGEYLVDSGAAGSKTLTLNGNLAADQQAFAIAAYKTAAGGGGGSPGMRRFGISYITVQY